MRIPACLLLLAAAAPKGDEPELPPVKTVTLQFEQIPTVEAASRFARAAGCTLEFYQGRHGWSVDQDDKAKAMTLDLRGVPFFEAVEKFCLAHGNLSWSVGERMKIVLHGTPAKNAGNRQQGRFLFWTNGVEEQVQSDFTMTVRRCTVRMEMAWQPDLRVLAVGPAVVSSVIDDRGRDLIQGTLPVPERGEFKEWDARGAVSVRLELPLAPRGARSISIRGRVALRVPRRNAFVELPFHGDLAPVRAGWVTFQPGVEGSGDDRKWRWSARSGQGKLTPEQFLDLRNGCESGYEYWIGWGKGGSIRGLEDGSVEMIATGRDESELSLRFTLVEGEGVVQVPFELKDVELPR